ncbi:MAG: hypothetical protein ACK5LN_02775 [Propioniciclava sp.]
MCAGTEVVGFGQTVGNALAAGPLLVSFRYGATAGGRCLGGY